jgi:hypothetical protein
MSRRRASRGLPLFLVVAALACVGISVSLALQGPAGMAFGIIGLAFALLLFWTAAQIARARR